MLIPPKPILTFKGKDCREFLNKHENRLDLLPELLENPMIVLGDMTKLQVSAFKKPFPRNCMPFHQDNGTIKYSHHISDDSVYFIFYGEGTNHL
jgi:hypothetical protein